LNLKRITSDTESLYAVGRRAAIELLEGDSTRIEKIYIAHGTHGDTIEKIRSLARSLKLALGELDRGKFADLERRYAKGEHTQGVIVLLSGVRYYELDEIFADPSTPPLLIALDGIEDPHNIGAIIRSAEAAGARCVLLPQRGAVLTPAVFRASAGAAFNLPVVKYNNLTETIFRLREEFEVRCIGLAGEASESIYEADLSGPVCLIVGSEEKGLHHLVRKRCDLLVRIPMSGKTASLNASVASAVALFEVIRQRELTK
jgi:23S rRNA (guanosine2251-2'-O)-methyltransferase